MDFDYHEEPGLCPPSEICQVPDSQVKNFQVRLPAGLIGNPAAVPQCTLTELTAFACPKNTIIGMAELRGNSFLYLPWETPVFNLVPAADEPARFGYLFLNAPVILRGTVRDAGDYGMTIEGRDFSQVLPVVGSRITLWGVPGDSRHDAERGGAFEGPVRPFLSLPSACSGPLTTSFRANSWQAPNEYLEVAFAGHDGSGNPVGIDGCSAVPFGGSLETKAEPDGAGMVAGLEVVVRIPPDESPDGRSTSMLKAASVRLPRGVEVNVAAAAGLAACTEAEVGLHSGEPARCPEASKIGAVRIATPLFADPLEGAVYVASPHDNPSGALLAGYLVAEGHGVILKQSVAFSLDPETGQVTATLEDMPLQPFSELDLDLYGGAHAALRLPPDCGSYTAHYELTPWSGASPVDGDALLAVGEDCRARAFSPSLEAGSTDAVAGAYSGFVLGVGRQDGEANLAGLDLTLPDGLAANLADVPVCPRAGVDVGNCPSESRVGGIYVAAGAGGAPLWVPRGDGDSAPVYLAGPFRGAPFSLVAPVPAQAGPFDLGHVVVRGTLRLDPRTARAHIDFDSLPQMLDGIPLDYRAIRIVLDRSGFVLNPTSCDESRISGVATSAGGDAASLVRRFQIGGCAALPFHPRLSLQASGGLGRHGHPAVRAVLRVEGGGANIAGAVLTLPGGELLDLRRIRGLCNGAVPPGNCDPNSRIGRIRVWSPLLSLPLQGGVYLRTPRHRLPGLLADLHGNRLRFVLHGQIATPDGRLRVRFGGLPDVPVSKAVIDFAGGRRGIVVNSRALCAGSETAKASLVAHNGKRRQLRTGSRCRFS